MEDILNFDAEKSMDTLNQTLEEILKRSNAVDKLKNPSEQEAKKIVATLLGGRYAANQDMAYDIDPASKMKLQELINASFNGRF